MTERPDPVAPDLLVSGREPEPRRVRPRTLTVLGVAVVAGVTGGATWSLVGHGGRTGRPPTRGTTVAVSVPAAAGYTCVPDFFRPQVVLATDDLGVVRRVLGEFGLTYARGAATLSHTGPQVSPADLQAVGAALAHSCGTTPDRVILQRHPPAA